ncbi:hypothetical protein HG530_015500 [Fusarium avenaceum]|nr:hypothetical protein HG530_015500 [Fusarium avenaceum]
MVLRAEPFLNHSIWAALKVVDNEGQGLANFELGAEDIDLVIGSDLVVVSRVGEGQGQHALLLQVGLVDTGERSSDDSKTTEVTRLKSGVLSGRTLAVVPVTNDNPLDALGLVVTGDGGNGTPLASGEVVDLVSLVVGLIDGTNQHVVGDVVEMTTDRHVLGILAIPRLEGSEDLKTVRGRSDVDADAGTVLRRSLVGVLAGVIASSRETIAGRRGKLELLAVLVLQSVGKRVEVKRAGNRHGNDQIRGGNERVSSGVAVISASEVTVVGRDNRVGLTLLDVLSVPLTNAGTASIGKNDATEFLKGLELTITLNSSADLLRTRGNSENRLSLDAMVEGIAGNGSSTPAVLLDSLAELGDRSTQVRSEGTVDMGLELREVDLNELVVLDTLVRAKTVGVGAGEVTNLLSLGGGEVVVHAVVEGEDGGSGTNFSTLQRSAFILVYGNGQVTYHVANRSHTGARNGIGSRAVVLNNGTSATLDAAEFAGQLDTNDIGGLELPVKVGHNINSIGTTDTNGSHTETTTVDSVGVSADEKTTGEGIVFKENLVDNTGAGLPETDVVLGTSSRKEVVNLLVNVNSAGKILSTTDLGLNQVVTVDSGGVGNLVHASGHELEDGHLSSGILASNTIRSQLEVACTSLDVLAVRISQVRVQDLLSVGQGSVQARTNDIEVVGHLLVVDEVALLPVVLADLQKRSRLVSLSSQPFSDMRSLISHRFYSRTLVTTELL